MSTDTILQRLDKVRETGPNKWVACCPAHDDRSPSLAITKCSDGRVLIHCFAGCESLDVLDAIGLRFTDIMPERLPEHRYKPQKPAFDARQVLAAVGHEISVASIIACRIAGVAGIAGDEERLLIAAARLNSAADMSSSIGTPPELRRIRGAEP